MKRNNSGKKILKGLLIAGAIYVAASSPYFALHLARNLRQALQRRRHLKPKEANNSPFNNAFYYLLRKGYLSIQRRNKQIYISLTKEGRKKAGKYLIDDLEIKKPKTWDGKWRVVIFDIPNLTNIKRAALRGKLKELAFYKLQRSIWVIPYECKKEIDLLKGFFGLNSRELNLITGRIEKDDFLRRHFKIL